MRHCCVYCAARRFQWWCFFLVLCTSVEHNTHSTGVQPAAMTDEAAATEAAAVVIDTDNADLERWGAWGGEHAHLLHNTNP